MEKNCWKYEQKLKKLIEHRIRQDRQEDMKDFLRDEVHFCEGDKLWQRLTDSDIISPSKGYGKLIEALEFVDEIRVKEDAQKIIDDIEKIQKQSKERRPRNSLKSQTSIDDNDAHKQLLNEIGRELTTKKDYVEKMKNYLQLQHPSHVTEKDCERDMDGLKLLMLMQKVDLLSRTNYNNLYNALDNIGLQKFHARIDQVNADYLRSDSCSENHPDYPKDSPAKGYVFDMGFRSRMVTDDIMKCGYTAQDKIDNCLKLPFDANVAIVLSEHAFDGKSTFIPAPKVERIGIKPVPVVHFVNVRCRKLPAPDNLPPVTVNATHTFAIFVLTSEATVAEKIWETFCYFLECPDPIEQVVKFWRQEIQENTDQDTFYIMWMSSLCRNLNISLKPLRR